MNRIFHRNNWKIWVVTIVSLLLAIIVFPKLPEIIPVHFDATGVPDRYGSRWSIFIFPGINLIMTILTEGLKRIDPKTEAYLKFEKQYYNVMFVVTLLMLGVQVITLSYVFGYEINISRIMPLILGSLLIYIGNVMPKFKHNYFVGIKTSWTLASETVWYHTHRLAGKLWVISGLVMLLLVLLPLEFTVWGIMALVFIMVLVPITASYFYFKKFE